MIRSWITCYSALATFRTSGTSFLPRWHSTNIIDSTYVVRSPFKPVPIPEINLYSHVFQYFPKYGKKTALIDGVTGREYSYNEVQESVVNMASGLVRSGMQKGDVLALVSPNSVEFCTTFFSTLAMGGIMSTCNPNYTSEELAYQFKNSNSKYVATIPSLLPTIQEAASKAGCVEKMIVLGDDGGVGEGKNMISYQSLVNDSGSRFPIDIKLDPKKDTAIIPYSSGTTGKPKGVVMNHYNMSSCLVQLENGNFLSDYYLTGRILSVIPFFHTAGMLVNMMVGLHTGSVSVTVPKFEPEHFLHTISQYKTTYTNLVPPLILFLANHPMVDKYDLSSLKHISYGAAPTGFKLAVAVKERLNLEYLQHGYGMTEMGVTHLTPQEVFKPESVGVSFVHNLCKIVDVETGTALGPNTPGELVVQGPQVMRGYLNNPEATKATIKDGWLHTGDFGYYDENGHFYITDRLKELIKVKGLQVAPAELEALLLQHPHISDVAVIGVDDERSGELPRAFVVRSSDELSEQEVEDFVKGQVAEHKQLKGGVKFIKEIPKSPSGKILRRLLKQ
ncbi:probable 4-coumarate--CoA ligase 3 isoform X2 [Dysidea avara]